MTARMLPDRLAAVIHAAGYAVKSLSRRTGVPARTVRRWLAGDHDPGWDNLQRLARALDVDPYELWGALIPETTREEFREWMEGRWPE